ncbi:MAG: preprotein translocase subunit SecG [Alphaproteobacteria bacterium]|jgi:preprotein translocase subunit SecG
MINFLIALDIILAILIIGGVFLHRGSDGFIGEATPTTVGGPRFETFDKVLAGIVISFFSVTLMINYLTLYQYKGTADIDAIIENTNLEEKAKKVDAQNPDFTTEAPIAE